MRHRFAVILILLLALIGQAVASVLPPACAHAEAEMSMDTMAMQPGETGASQSGVASGAFNNCDCCADAGNNCTFAGCFAAALPPSPLTTRAPALQLPGKTALEFQISPTPPAPLFRPPIG